MVTSKTHHRVKVKSLLQTFIQWKRLWTSCAKYWQEDA